VLATECGRRQHLVARVDVQVVLLGAHHEVLQPRHDRIVRSLDGDEVIDDVPGMRHELTAHHELVGRAAAEGVAHAAMPAGEADAALDRPDQAPLLFLRELPHRPHRHDQIEFGQRVLVGENRERVRPQDLVAGGLEVACGDLGERRGLVSLPAAMENQCSFHGCLLWF
jgi:hypothetical protein